RGEPILTGPADSIANMRVIHAVYRAAGLEPRRPTSSWASARRLVAYPVADIGEADRLVGDQQPDQTGDAGKSGQRGQRTRGREEREKHPRQEDAPPVDRRRV